MKNYLKALLRRIWLSKNSSTNQHYDVKDVNQNSADPKSSVLKLDVDHGWAWCVMISTFIGCFLSGGISYSLGIYYTELIKVYPSKAVIVGLLTGLPGSLILLIGPFGIFISEKYGYFWALAIGGIGGFSGFVLSAYATNLGILCFTLGVMLGLGSGMVLTPAVCALRLSFDRLYLIAHSGAVSGIAFGYLLFPFIFRYLIDTYGLSHSLLINAAIFLNTLIAAALLKPLPSMRLITPHGIPETSGEIALSTISSVVVLDLTPTSDDINHVSPSANKMDVDQPKDSEKFFNTTRIKMSLFMVYAGLEQAGTIILTVLIPYYSETRGISSFKSSSMVSFLGMGDFIGSIVVVSIGFIIAAINKSNRKTDATKSLEVVENIRRGNVRSNCYLFHATMICHISFSLAYLIPITGLDKLFGYLSTLNFLFGMSYGIRLSLLTTFISHVFGPNKFTTVYGSYVMFAGWGSLFCVPLSSYLVGVFGTPKTIFYLICIIFVSCECLLLFVSNLKTKHTAPIAPQTHTTSPSN